MKKAELLAIKKELKKKWGRCKTLCPGCHTCQLWWAYETLSFFMIDKWYERPSCKQHKI